MPESPAIIAGVSTRETDEAEARMRHWRARMMLAASHLSPQEGGVVAAVLGVNGGMIPRLSAHGAHIDKEGRLFADMVDINGKVHRKVWFGFDTVKFRDLFSRLCEAIDIQPGELEELRTEVRAWIGLDLRVADQQREMLK